MEGRISGAGWRRKQDSVNGSGGNAALFRAYSAGAYNVEADSFAANARASAASIWKSLWWPCAASLVSGKRIISTAANHLGALGAGSPSGVSLPTAIKI
jgi:hypothetical protein